MSTSHDGFPMNRARPSAELVAQAKQEYAEAREKAEELVSKTRALLNDGWTDFEAVVDVFATLYVQRGKPGTALVSAVTVVLLAKANTPDITIDDG